MGALDSLRLVKLRSSGAEVFLHPCEGCGRQASFGRDVDIRAAHALRDAGATYSHKLGTLTCGPDGCRA